VTIKESLVAARALIADESKWTTDYIARKANGHFCSADDPGACKWCAQGAVLVCLGGKVGRSYLQVVDLLDAVATDMGYGDKDDQGKSPSAQLNDESSHLQVLAMFDRAIQEAA